MKPTTCVLIGVAFLSAAIPVTAGAFVWWMSSNRQEEEEVSWVMHINRGSIIEPVDQGPPVQPPGTTLMSVRITSDEGTANANMTGWKVMLLAHKKTDKMQKEVVFPVVVDALVMSIEPSGSGSKELLVSLAVPDDQIDRLTQAVEYETSLRIKSPPCGGWLPRESDSQIFLAAPSSTEELVTLLLED